MLFGISILTICSRVRIFAGLFLYHVGYQNIQTLKMQRHLAVRDVTVSGIPYTCVRQVNQKICGPSAGKLLENRVVAFITNIVKKSQNELGINIYIIKIL